jgi:hypothetical protein
VGLNGFKGIKEEYLGVFSVDGGTQGFTKFIQDTMNFEGLYGCGNSKNHGVIHKLVVGNRRLDSMQWKTLEISIYNGFLDVSS